MSLMSGSCAKGFYSNRIWIVANATKLIGWIRYKLWKFNANYDRILYVKGGKSVKIFFINGI